jgi:capsule polysaccharide export protein KpsE/RkpR
MHHVASLKRAFLGLGLLAGASALAGCAQKRVAECNALILVINTGVQGLEKTPKTETDPTGVSDLKAMAERMDRVAAETAGVPVTLPEVKKLASDYQKMAKDIAKAERELATAAESRDAAKRSAAEQSLDAAVKQEDPLVDSINKFCQTQ